MKCLVAIVAAIAVAVVRYFLPHCRQQHCLADVRSRPRLQLAHSGDPEICALRRALQHAEGPFAPRISRQLSSHPWTGWCGLHQRDAKWTWSLCSFGQLCRRAQACLGSSNHQGRVKSGQGQLPNLLHRHCPSVQQLSCQAASQASRPQALVLCSESPFDG